MTTRHTNHLTTVVALILVAGLSQAVFADEKPKPTLATLARAYADLGLARAANVKAYAEYVIRAAEAAKTVEETRTVKLANNLKKAEVYFERKRLNRLYRNEFHKRTVNAEQAARIARMGRPNGLGQLQAGLVSVGATQPWPYILTTAKYDTCRERIESVLQQQGAVAAGMGTRNCHEIQTAAHEMQQILKHQVHELRPMEWTHANTFLKNLAHNAGQPRTNSQNILASR